MKRTATPSLFPPGWGTFFLTTIKVLLAFLVGAFVLGMIGVVPPHFLTGLIAALLGQGLDAFAAAQLGVYIHGLAGDLAREAFGEVSLIATDLIDYLPVAFLRHTRQ